MNSQDGWRRRSRRSRQRAGPSLWPQRLVRWCRGMFLLLCIFVFVYVTSYGRKVRRQGPHPTTKLSPTAQHNGSSTVTWPVHFTPQPGGYTHSKLGVFVLVDLATQQPDANKSLANCSETVSVNEKYGQYILYYPGQTPTDADSQAAQQVVDQMVGCRMRSTVVRVDGGHSRDAAALNLAMMDAYLNDGVDFYLVIFAGTSPQHARKLRELAPTLRERMMTTKQWKGFVLIENLRTVNTSPTAKTGRQLPAAVFFTKTHFDIFGLFFPVALPDIPSAVALLADLYLHMNLTMSLHRSVQVVSKTHDAAASWPQAWQQELDTLTRYLAAENSTACLYCGVRRSTDVKGLSVISMSLYGAGRRYTMGAVRNAQLAPVVFPGWRLRFYVERTAKPRYAAVPESVLGRLQQLGAELVDAPADQLAPMMWRFTVLDDPGVEKFIIRDADSRLTPRDHAVVTDWLRQGPVYTFHCVRDHPSHSIYSISGGLWGGRRAPLASRFGGSLRALMSKYDAGYVADMRFLGKHVWPAVKDVAFCHDSYSCQKFPASHAFPVRRKGAEHIGAVYDHLSIMRRIDTDILSRAPVNRQCVPPG